MGLLDKDIVFVKGKWVARTKKVEDKYAKKCFSCLDLLKGNIDYCLGCKKKLFKY